MAEYASKIRTAIADEFDNFRLPGVMFSLSFKHATGLRYITWSDLISGLEALSDFTPSRSQYRESSVTWYTQSSSEPKTDHGVLSTWGFYLPPGTNPGRWSPGPIEWSL